MGNYAIIVEGRTDSALIEAILEVVWGYKLYENVNDLPDIFKDLVGRYPTPKSLDNKQNSLRPNGFPIFYHSEDSEIVIKIANGNNKIFSTIRDTLEVIMAKSEDNNFGGFIVITDKDKYTEDEIRAAFKKKLQENKLSWNLDNNQLRNEYDEYSMLYLYAMPQNGMGQ